MQKKAVRGNKIGMRHIENKNQKVDMYATIATITLTINGLKYPIKM